MKVAQVMTPDPVVCSADAGLAEAATVMRDRNIGDVLVERDGQVYGIVTDRDIVVRGLTEGNDPGELTLADVATTDVQSVSPDDDVDDVLEDGGQRGQANPRRRSWPGRRNPVDRRSRRRP